MAEIQAEFKPAEVPAVKSTITTDIAPTGGLIPKDFESLYRVAKIMSASGLMPAGIERPEAVFVAVQMGLEVGLSPMASVQNIAVINGRPAIWGDSVLALVRASGKLESFNEQFVGNYPDDSFAAVCTAKRVGEDPVDREFSIADAKRAGLWVADKQGLDYKKKLTPWYKYPKRMLQMRARSWALRDGFGDVLKGLRVAEEVQDYDVDMRQGSGGSYAVDDTAASDNAAELVAKLGKPCSAAQGTEYSPANEVVEGDAEPAPATPPNKGPNQTRGYIDAIKGGATSDNPEAPAEKENAERTTPPEHRELGAEGAEVWARPSWAKLRKSGYSTFVFANLAAVNQAAPAEIKKEMVEKWNRLYDEPCPILIGTADVLPPEQQTGQDQLDATIEAEKKAGIGIDHPPDDAPDSWKEPVHKNTGGLSDMADPVPTPDSPVPDHMNTPSDDMEARERRNMQAVIIDSYEANDIINAQLKLGFTAGITNLSALTLDALVALRDELMVA